MVAKSHMKILLRFLDKNEYIRYNNDYPWFGIPLGGECLGFKITNEKYYANEFPMFWISILDDGFNKVFVPYLTEGQDIVEVRGVFSSWEKAYRKVEDELIDEQANLPDMFYKPEEFVAPDEREKELNNLHYFDNANVYFEGLISIITQEEPNTIKRLSSFSKRDLEKIKENSRIKKNDPNLKHYAEVILEGIDLELSRRNLFEKRVNYFMTSCNMDELLRCIKLGKIGSNLGDMPIDCRIILNSATEELSKRKPPDDGYYSDDSINREIYPKDFEENSFNFFDCYDDFEDAVYKECEGVEEKSPYSSEDIYRGEDEGWIYED